jgi:hypothetical protein
MSRVGKFLVFLWQGQQVLLRPRYSFQAWTEVVPSPVNHILQRGTHLPQAAGVLITFAMCTWLFSGAELLSPDHWWQGASLRPPFTRFYTAWLHAAAHERQSLLGSCPTGEPETDPRPWCMVPADHSDDYPSCYYYFTTFPQQGGPTSTRY